MSDDLYKTPESDLGIEKEVVEAELASRWARLFGSILDGIIIGLVTTPVLWAMGWFDMILSGEQPGTMMVLASGLGGVAIFALINGYFIVDRGQTIGKMALGTRMVMVDGSHPEMPAWLKRYAVLMLVPQIPLVGSLINLVNVLFIFNSEKRCLHDLAAGTKVVKAQ